MQKIKRRQRLTARLLQPRKPQHAAACTDVHAVRASSQHLTRPCACRNIAMDLGGQELDHLALERAARPRKRGESANFSLQHLGRQPPVQRRLTLVDFGGISHALHRLRQRAKGACRSGLKRLDDQLATQDGQRLNQRVSGVMRADGHARTQQHVAGVQARVHLHNGHASLRVARLDGAVNRGRTTPARQQRSMDVQAAHARRGKRPQWQYQPISGHHHRVSACLGYQ